MSCWLQAEGLRVMLRISSCDESGISNSDQPEISSRDYSEIGSCDESNTRAGSADNGAAVFPPRDLTMGWGGSAVVGMVRLAGAGRSTLPTRRWWRRGPQALGWVWPHIWESHGP
ncbi:hypothetical protein AAFF_G00441110 [Aldrovandia affinis]|uniref:Uncharacterized protein n=1 Tax=Aldrovandia affinis TaxID=143900 RepID=A0AAD7S787_9TELE|nr:hypothetical protein AAFF_G00441110 [Aldrovandia affinis]